MSADNVDQCLWCGGCELCGYSEAQMSGWEYEAEGHERSCQLVESGWGQCNCIMQEQWARERGWQHKFPGSQW